MKDPKRYTLAEPDISYGVDESKKGEFVYWSDYARLKAEVERLRASSFVTAVPCEVYEELKAEVERLRKAGDAMYGYITDVILEGRISSHYLNKLQDDWDNAAKDGKPTE
jgi:hypothetical protein